MMTAQSCPPPSMCGPLADGCNAIPSILCECRCSLAPQPDADVEVNHVWELSSRSSMLTAKAAAEGNRDDGARGGGEHGEGDGDACVLYEEGGGIATLTVNRPKVCDMHPSYIRSTPYRYVKFTSKYEYYSYNSRPNPQQQQVILAEPTGLCRPVQVSKRKTKCKVLGIRARIHVLAIRLTAFNVVFPMCGLGLHSQSTGTLWPSTRPNCGHRVFQAPGTTQQQYCGGIVRISGTPYFVIEGEAQLGRVLTS